MQKKEETFSPLVSTTLSLFLRAASQGVFYLLSPGWSIKNLFSFLGRDVFKRFSRGRDHASVSFEDVALPRKRKLAFLAQVLIPPDFYNKFNYSKAFGFTRVYVQRARAYRRILLNQRAEEEKKLPFAQLLALSMSAYSLYSQLTRVCAVLWIQSVCLF